LAVTPQQATVLMPEQTLAASLTVLQVALLVTAAMA
jgi:hypothetical protein